MQERLVASIKDGKIRVVIDRKGIHLTNEIGPVNIKCRKLILSGKASRWKTEKAVTIKANGNINIKTKKALSLASSGDVTLTGSPVNLKGSSGVTAEGKQIAIENDPVAGMDLHDIEVPSSRGTQRVPAIPHPYIGKLNDKLSSDVNVKGKPAAVEGSKCEFTTPGHFPMPRLQARAATEGCDQGPGVKFSKNPNNKGEVTGGCIDSVEINGKPVAVLGSTVTTCDDGGQKDQCVIVAPGTTVTFPIQYPGQDPEQFKRDGGLPVNVSRPAVYTPEETAYAGQPKSLSGLQWSETRVQKGTEVTLSCATSGVKDRASVMFSIFPEGADPEVDPPVMEMRGKNEGGRAEVKWVARDIRKPEDEGAMKWFFTAWTLYCPKEKSGLVRVLNPRVKQIEWEKKAVFWGNEAKLNINSFEISETSPTYTLELWEQDDSDPDDFISSQDITFDKDEMEINYTLDFDLSLVSDFNRDKEYQLYCKILDNSGNLIASSPLCEMHGDY